VGDQAAQQVIRSILLRAAASHDPESQQARTQQHEASRYQHEEPIGDQIVIAHDTPLTCDARPNRAQVLSSATSADTIRDLGRFFHYTCVRSHNLF
jgi:hypothetical protein